MAWCQPTHPALRLARRRLHVLPLAPVTLSCSRHHCRASARQPASSIAQNSSTDHQQPGGSRAGLRQAVGVALLGSLWVLGRPAAPAVAAPVRPTQHLVVSIAPQASAATAVANEARDSCAVLVGVCLGFYMLSATVSAGIGAALKLAGKPLAVASSGSTSTGWSTASVEDTLDIMVLPLAYVDEPQAVSGPAGTWPARDSVTYAVWEGPDTYIPVSMVKGFEPGLLEAGRVARRSLLQTEGSNLSIVSVTRPADDSSVRKLPTSGNGGSSNGSGNGNSNGSSKNQPEDSSSH